MSNNPWSIPEAGTQMSPPTTASPPVALGAPSPPRRTGRIVAAVVAGLVGLAGIGAVVYLMFGRGDGSPAGAQSPEAAVTGLASAISADDSLAALQFVAPDEIEGVADLLQAAMEQTNSEGVDVGAGGNADLTVTVSNIHTTQLADRAARVTFDLDGSVLATARLAGLVGEGGSMPTTEVSAIAVQLDGGWFLSPLLTAGDRLVDHYDLPSGDYQRVGEKPVGVKAASPEEAVTTFLEGIADLDVDQVAGALSSGEARAVLVFGDALDELTDDADGAMSDNGVTTALDDVELSDLGDGRVGVDGMTVDWTSFNDDVSVELDHDCVVVRSDGDRNRACAFDNAPLTTPLEHEQLVLRTHEEDGGFRVDLIRSAADMGTEVLGAVDHQALFALIGGPQFGTAQPLTLGVEQTVTFSGERSQLFELQVPAGTDIEVDATSTDDDVYADTQEYIQRDGRWEELYSDDLPAAEPSVVRVVVEVDCDDWDDTALIFQCSSWEQGDVTISTS